jgi:hypothetical protein
MATKIALQCSENRCSSARLSGNAGHIYQKTDSTAG